MDLKGRMLLKMLDPSAACALGGIKYVAWPYLKAVIHGVNATSNHTIFDSQSLPPNDMLLEKSSCPNTIAMRL